MELAPVGYFSKTHGVKGHLILRMDTGFFIEALKAIFIETSTGKAPYFIRELKESNNGLILALEDVNAVEQARPLIGKKVFIDAGLLDEEEDDSDWIGFELIDKTYGSLGSIGSVSDNGQQPLLNLTYRGREIILPLVEDFIEQVDEENKKLYYNAPEGLIDVYLEDDPSDPL